MNFCLFFVSRLQHVKINFLQNSFVKAYVKVNLKIEKCRLVDSWFECMQNGNLNERPRQRNIKNISEVPYYQRTKRDLMQSIKNAANF